MGAALLQRGTGGGEKKSSLFFAAAYPSIKAATKANGLFTVSCSVAESSSRFADAVLCRISEYPRRHEPHRNSGCGGVLNAGNRRLSQYLIIGQNYITVKQLFMSAINEIASLSLAQFYNSRVTLYPDENGIYCNFGKVMVAERQIFRSGKAELSEGFAANAKKNPPKPIYPDEDEIEYLPWDSGENLRRAQRRAFNRVRDLVSCNNWKWFITFTLDENEISRTDYDEVIKKLNVWLSNRVQRHGLKYVIVPEFHADGAAIHFHGVVNELPKLVYSGKRKRYASGTKRVYNVPDWSYGFSTAIRCSGDAAQVGHYIAKYITKGSRKVGGRYFLHGGKLNKPMYYYFNCDYELVSQSNECSIDEAGLQLKIVNYNHFIDFLPPLQFAAFAAGFSAHNLSTCESCAT